jgi:transposase
MMLSDENWVSLSKLMKLTGRVYNKPEHRFTLEGILYRMRTGCPWRDLPSEFGNWNTVFRRFNLWSRKGVMTQLFKALSVATDAEWVFLDASIVRAHQHSHGAASPGEQAIGNSRGGRTTKIHLAVDSYGLPVHFELSAGQVADISRAAELLDGTPVSESVIADKGYDSQALRAHIEARGSRPVIPRRKNNSVGNDDMDWWLYRYRHLVENAFARVKHFRAISTRYDKLERNFASMITLAFIVMWLPM